MLKLPSLCEEPLTLHDAASAVHFASRVCDDASWDLRNGTHPDTMDADHLRVSARLLRLLAFQLEKELPL